MYKLYISTEENIEPVLLKSLQSTEIQAESIEMKFLESGHSYLPNDSQFAIIVSHAKKVQNIFSPYDWYNVIKLSKKKAPFHTVQMTHQDFFSTSTLENSINNRKVSVPGIPVNWLKMHWIKLEKSKPYLIQLKYDFNENTEFNAINIRKSVTSRPLCLKNVIQRLLRPTGRTVTREKRKDMVDLLEFIPPIKQEYSKTLRTNREDGSSNTANEDDIIFNDDNAI
uniref:Uncharacterized protein n=1 Tax=Glossina pallidipes TaxID=7398 RepID=A0A1A9ZVC3_GLOPL